MTKPDVDSLGKIQFLNWDWIMAQSTVECTFCLNQREVQTIMAIIQPVGWMKRWYSLADAAISQDEIEALRDNLARKLMQNCCSDTTILRRFNATTGDNEISTDGGENWSIDPEDPRVQGIAMPPPVTTGTAGTKCDAASNALQHYKDKEAAFSHDLGTGITIASLVAEMCLALLVELLTAGSLSFYLIPLVVNLAIAIVNIAKDDYDNLFTSDVWDGLLCILFCNIGDDGSFTQAQYLEVLTEIDAQFTGNIALTLNSITRGWGLIGLNNAASMGATADADCGSCTCGCIVDHWGVGIWVSGSFLNNGNQGTLVETGDCYMIVDSHDRGDGTQAVYVGQPAGDGSTNCADVTLTIISGTANEASVATGCGTDRDFTNFVTVVAYGNKNGVGQLSTVPFRARLDFTPA